MCQLTGCVVRYVLHVNFRDAYSGVQYSWALLVTTADMLSHAAFEGFEGTASRRQSHRLGRPEPYAL